MAILGKYQIEDFLSHYWQQKPLLIRSASQDYLDVLSPDELAGMACEDQVESRLIIGKDLDWVLENGPIPEQRFASLPEADWTLLVQSVDQWLPEVRDILAEFDFLPSWRLDDVMISYAAPGGSVGPHFDYYDVFLLQTKGQRRWKLGQHCDQNSSLLANQQLKLLEHFEQTEEFDLSPGDMLYIPASVAHWGIGLDDQCMTWSIGFRAPSAKELLAGAIDLLTGQLPEHIRYRDSMESLKGDRAQINTAALKQVALLKEVFREDLLTEAMKHVLGAMATEPRYPELIEAPSEQDLWTLQEVASLFEKDSLIVRNDASRLAYSPDQHDEAISKLYVNGEILETTTELAVVACGEDPELESFRSEQGQVLLLKLLNSGAYLTE